MKSCICVGDAHVGTRHSRMSYGAVPAIYVSTSNSNIVMVMKTAVPAFQRGRILYLPMSTKIHPIEKAIAIAAKVIPGMRTEKAVMRFMGMPAASATRIPVAISVLTTAVTKGPSGGDLEACAVSGGA
jgi:hypothetical protein